MESFYEVSGPKSILSSTNSNEQLPTLKVMVGTGTFDLLEIAFWSRNQITYFRTLVMVRQSCRLQSAILP